MRNRTFEPARPCVVYVKVVGTIEYLGDGGQVIESANAQILG